MMLSELSWTELPTELAASLTARSGVTITRDEVLARFYFYVFPLYKTEGNEHCFVLAIDAKHPKGEKYLRVDNDRWVPSERLKF